MAEGGMKVPLVVDKEGGTKQINDWLKEQDNKEVTIGIDSSPFKEAIKDAQGLFQAIDDLASPPGLDDLRKRSDEAKDAMQRARKEVEDFALALLDVDRSADPTVIASYQRQLDMLNSTLADTSRVSQQAAAAVTQQENLLRVSREKATRLAAEEAKKQEENLKQIFSEARGWIGDLGDASGALSQTLFKLSDAEAAAADQAFAMAEKGMALGEVLGPWGSVLGGLAGVTLSLFASGIEEAAEAVKKKTDAVIRDLEFTRQQQALTEKATEAFANYTTEVQRAGKIEISNVLSLLTSEKTLFAERTEFYRKNIDEIEKKRLAEITAAEATRAAEGNLNTDRQIAAINANHNKTKAANEAAIAHEEELATIRLVTNAHLQGGDAIETVIADLYKQRQAMSDIGKEKSIKELNTDLIKAREASDKAVTAVEDLRTELEKKQADGGFLGTFQSFYDRMVTLPRLIAAAEEALGLEAGAAGAVEAEKDKQKGKLTAKQEAYKRDEEFREGIIAIDRQYEEEELAANREFERQLAASEEAARQKEIDEIIEWNETLEQYEIDKAKRVYDANLQLSIDLHELRVERNREELANARQAAEDQAAAFKESADAARNLLESDLMPVIESVTGRLYENIEAGKDAFEGFGDAVASGIRDALKAIGKQFAVQALGEAASGLASLALGPIGGISAGAHFAAAAGFAAAAVAAGVGSALVGRSVAQETSPTPVASSGNSNEGFSGGPGGQSRAFTTDVKAPLVINVSGVPFGVLSLRELAVIGGRVTEASAVYAQNGSSVPE